MTGAGSRLVSRGCGRTTFGPRLFRLHGKERDDQTYRMRLGTDGHDGRGDYRGVHCVAASPGQLICRRGLSASGALLIGWRKVFK